MKPHPLPSQHELQKMFDYDRETGSFVRLKTTGSRAVRGTKAGSLARNGYIQIWIGNKRYMAHRLAWVYVTGEDPLTLEVDHINRDKRDNRFANLRLVSSSQNKLNANKRSHNTSGYKGVSLDRRRGIWRALIVKEGKQHFIGHYRTPEEARNAYDEAALSLHGQYAVTNASLLEVTK